MRSRVASEIVMWRTKSKSQVKVSLCRKRGLESTTGGVICQEEVHLLLYSPVAKWPEQINGFEGDRPY